MRKHYFLNLVVLLSFTVNAQVELVKFISSNAKTNSLAATNFGLVFCADDNPSILNMEPYFSDGSETGTFKLNEINANNVVTNASSVSPTDDTQFIELNGYVYFAAGSASNNVELWRTDGTTVGTTLVKEINASTSSSSNPNYITVLNNSFVFSASNGLSGSNNGTELWISDGTTAGTVLLKDINPGTASSSPSNFVHLDGEIFFTADNGTNGRELWKTDGTSSGTVMVKDLVVGVSSSNPQYTTVYNGDLYFRAAGELYKSTGVVGNGGVLKNINTSGNSDPIGFKVFNGRLYFSADDGVNGRELWRTNGTVFGTQLFKDINSGSGNSSPQDFEISNATLFFKATSSSNTELWKSDGLAVNTVAITSSNLNPQKLTNYNNKVYFVGPNNRLWVSDGSTSGTYEVSGTYSNIINVYKMTVFDDELFFGAGNLYKYLDPTLSNDEFVETQSFKLYPNPTSSYFSISSNMEIKNLEVFDILGKKVKAFTNVREFYNISDLRNGIYFIKFNSKNKTQTIKLIKK